MNEKKVSWYIILGLLAIMFSIIFGMTQSSGGHSTTPGQLTKQLTQTK